MRVPVAVRLVAYCYARLHYHNPVSENNHHKHLLCRWQGLGFGLGLESGRCPGEGKCRPFTAGQYADCSVEPSRLTQLLVNAASVGIQRSACFLSRIDMLHAAAAVEINVVAEGKYRCGGPVATARQ